MRRSSEKSRGTKPKIPNFRNMDSIFLVLTALILPLLWVALIPRGDSTWQPAETTTERLLEAEKLVEVYLREIGEVPASLADLKIFAAATDRTIQLHDGWGARFDYLRLDPQHFVMRSFGRDGLQNTLVSAPDDGIFRSGSLPKQSIVSTWRALAKPSPYQAVALVGSDAPTHVWHARLFIDPAAGTRRLLVRRRDASNLHMFAPHDAVEEFLWLPSGQQIVFSASGSSRWRDGIWLWNLLDDSLINLLDLPSGDSIGAQESSRAARAAPTSREENWFVSLLDVTVAPQVIHAAVWPRSNAPLDPKAFYGPDARRAWEIPDPTTGKAESPKAVASIVKNDLLAETFDASRTRAAVTDDERGTRTQRTWLKLPLSGPRDQVIGRWQEFAEKQAQTPLFPYALWTLTGLYAEAWQSMPVNAGETSETAEVLRSYGAEVAKALAGIPMAPLYLRAMGGHIWNELVTSQRPTSWRLGAFDGAGT
jgi:hypothetical protein